MYLPINRKYTVKYKKGDKIGNSITIIRFEYRGIKGINYYTCKCSCGNEFLARERDLVLNIVKDCGHNLHIRLLKDLANKDFGLLHVEKINHVNPPDHKVQYLCTCKCGNKVIISGYNLRHIKTPSCGCLSLQMQLDKRITHNMSNTRFHHIWTSMRFRCNTKTCCNYKKYGGRGITYDPRWDIFENFYDDMYESYCKHVEEYGESETTLDRIDVNGNYYKENCRWATHHEQLINRRNSIYIKFGNKEYSECEAYKFFSHPSIKYGTFTKRIRDGIDPVIALSLPNNLSYNSIKKERREEIINILNERNVHLKCISVNKANEYKDQLEYLRKHNLFKFNSLED